MKKLLLLLALVLTSFCLLSQKNVWLNYDFDSIISNKMPAEVFEIDTIMKGMRIYQVFAHTENATFIVQKSLFENESQNKELSRLPHDLEGLDKLYNETTNGIVQSIPFDLKLNESIDNGTFKGYRLRFQDSLNNSTYEIELYLLNRHLYSFYYVSLGDFDYNEKDLFFNSIRINTDEKISQFLGKSPSYRRGYLFAEYSLPILIIVGLIFFFVRRRKK